MNFTTDFHKGHGAGNDFVIVPEQFDPSPEQVALICDRHFGIGADGLLRVARAAQYPESRAKWFMDYRNADGSLAQTCGNGIRVFARHLVEQGLESRGEFLVGTRGGDVQVQVSQDDSNFERVVVNMGAIEISDATTSIATNEANWSGRPAFMANPHCVVELPVDATFPSLDSAPTFSTSVFVDGVNVEFIKGLGVNHISQRTHERGVGETLACGSGACAAAAVYAHNHQLGDEWCITVDLLGGQLVVTQAGGELYLQGPAQIVALGTLVLQ